MRVYLIVSAATTAMNLVAPILVKIDGMSLGSYDQALRQAMRLICASCRANACRVRCFGLLNVRSLQLSACASRMPADASATATAE